jgi:hypothetical protein
MDKYLDVEGLVWTYILVDELESHLRNPLIVDIDHLPKLTLLVLVWYNSILVSWLIHQDFLLV